MGKGSHLALGIDVGGTRIKAGLVNDRGQVLEAKVIPTEREKGSAYVLAQIAQLSRDLAQTTSQKISGMGLALPGEINEEDGICLYCPNLQWGQLPISKPLQKETGLPVKIINDANAACLGEYFFGGGGGVPTFLSITLGTGIGSGLILEGQLFKGRFGSGVEAGHMVVEPRGIQCACGCQGCWETIVSIPALLRRSEVKLKNWSKHRQSPFSILEGQTITPETVFQAFRQGDSLAREVVEETIFYLAIGLANLINLFNPYKISLGGGMATAEIVSAELNKQIDDYVFPTMRGKVEIFQAKLGYYGGIVGAASLWLNDR